MQLSLEVKKEIKKLIKEGLSSREVAKKLLISKSSVNNYRNSTEEERKPKVCIIDVETSAAKVYCFGRWNQNIGQDNVYEEGGKILCASWRWLGEDTTYSIHLSPTDITAGDDYNTVNKLFHLYTEADVVVMHNAKKFDHKVIQTRVLYWLGVELPTVKVIDTLQIAKTKLRLPSNKLDSIGEYFNLGRKIKTEGISLWAKVQEGCTESMAKMVTYCKQDVNLLYDVYVLLTCLGTANSGFNAGHYYNDNKLRCKECGSTNLTESNRSIYTLRGQYREYYCDDCGATVRDSNNTFSTEKKNSLLV